MASKKRSRATLASVTFDSGLRSSLVHLPIALYGPLLERGVPAQSIVVELVRADDEGNEVEEPSPESINKIYVGWSGMSAAPLSAESGAFSTASTASSSSSSASSVIAMSPTLSGAFLPPLREGAHVRITLLRSPPLPRANRVDVVPLTADDWEILSLNADEVENNMLGQVRAARTGMIIAVHVGRQGRTVCRFRVESCDPPTQSYAVDDGSDSTTLARAVRLSTDTEVVIAPRSRKSATEEALDNLAQPVDFSNGHAASSHVSSTSIFQTPLAAQQYLQRSPFRILPNNLFTPSQAGVTLTSKDAQILSVAFAGSSSRCAITRLPCPAAPQVYAHSAFLKGQSSRQGISQHGSKLHSPEKEKDKEEEGSSTTTITSSSAPAAPRATTSTHYAAAPLQSAAEWLEWPSRHVLVSDQIREKLNLRDFDLVRFSSPSPIGSMNASTPTPSRPGSPVGRESGETDGKEQSDRTTLAGFDTILQSCSATIENAFRIRRWAAMRASLRGQHGQGGQMSKTSAGLLLVGGPGSGKTSVARVIADRLTHSFVATIYIDCTIHTEERLSAMRSLFDQWLAAAVWHSPTLLVFDNLDRIVPADQEHVDSPRSAQLAEALMHRVRDITAQHAVYILATAQSSLSVNKVCNSAHHVFGETVELKAPSKDARRDILRHLVAQRSHLQPDQLNFTTIAGQTEGYLPADLRDLVERAIHQSAVRSLDLDIAQTSASPNRSRTLTDDDFEQAQKGFTPFSLRDIKLTQSATRWSDIGGLQETRRVLRETLEWPTKYAKVFAQCPLRLRSGLLLYGYPGCGKTLLAGAVARECGLNFISVKGPEILNKYIGASEKSVRDLFDRAQAAKPCVLFFDEFDSIAPKRGHDSTGVTDRVVNQLLTQMDGAEGLSGVYVLAATSRPDLIDSALLRPGRLDKSLLCDLPSEEDRLDILRVLCGHDRVRLDQDVSLAQWAKRTEGFSGADLQALVYNANLEAIHENMNKALHADAEGTGDDRGNGAQTTEEDDDDKVGNVQFVSFGGAKKDRSTAMSGAERQALQRRMELILGNARAERAEKGGSRLARPTFAERGVGGGGELTTTSSTTKAKQNTSAVRVTDAQLQKCFKQTRQSVPADEQRRLRKIYQQFVGERSGEFPDGQASQEIGARQSLM